mgnify:FL=1
MKHIARSRLTQVAALAAASMLAVGGCSTSPPTSSASSDSSGGGAASASSAAGTAATGPLSAFYTQQLDWKSCDDGECAKLRVPIDYAKPSGPSIEVAVNRMKATGTKKGSLVVNPGGPGGSGVDYAAAADQIVSKSVRDSYDIVGFDPRGVQRSAAITCVDDATLDQFMGSDPSPDDKSEQNALLAGDKKLADACKKNAGPLLGHVSTEEVAKDMDVLRAALGEQKLNFLGKSYGTMLGATYADLFAKNVGRMVLDGVLPPDLTMQQINEGQATGFEKALDAYLADCVSGGKCPLGSDAASAKKKLQTWLAGLDAKPIKASGDKRLSTLTEGWAINGIAASLYDQAKWGELTQALRSALGGDGTQLLNAGKSYAERNDDGTYQSNMMQVLNAVTCLDRPAPTGGVAEYEKDAEAFSKKAPTWGRQMAWAGAVCADWPVKTTGRPHEVKAAGSAPIVVLGTTRDPATPYEWSERLAGELQNSRFISYDGDGHTAYGRGSQCVDDAVDHYLVDGSDPAKKTTC